jgi:hypothetical protein
MNTLGRGVLAGFWSVLQTIPIGGSSGKGREFPLDLNSRHFLGVFHGCATGLRNHFLALAALAFVSPSFLGGDSEFAGPLVLRRFQKRLTKTAACCLFFRT